MFIVGHSETVTTDAWGAQLPFSCLDNGGGSKGVHLLGGGTVNGVNQPQVSTIMYNLMMPCDGCRGSRQLASPLLQLHHCFGNRVDVASNTYVEV